MNTWLTERVPAFMTWLVAGDTLTEFAVALLVLGICVWLSPRLAAMSDRWVKSRGWSDNLSFEIHWKEAWLLGTLMAGLWMCQVVLAAFKPPAIVLLGLTNLVAAWAAIRLVTGFITHGIYSKIVAISLWVFVALGLLGWLEEAADLMDNAAIGIGSVRISLLQIVKGIASFALLFWILRALSGMATRTLERTQGLTPSHRVLFLKAAHIAMYSLGAIVGLNIMGLDLTALAVFSGALGLGIGFGLQKIFANLISGIILLLDNSVKPGDVISVGGTYGWVNSLGARYVSVLTRDGKEHLIPNENLMSQEVENWSHSNKSVRVHVPIGVAYHSDLLLVRRLLLQAADDHPRILKDPKPACLLKGFGDSAVEHELRVWIETPEQGIANIQSDVYYRIWALFVEHGVEIPFPQRELRVRPQHVTALVDELKSAQTDSKPE